jgi:ADP-heptose:LPS heptosyltransferase
LVNLNSGLLLMGLVRDLFYVLFDLLAMEDRRGGECSNGLLFVRMDSIGDFVVWLDSADRLRSFFKDGKITLVANSIWAGLAKRLPFFDEVISVDKTLFVESPSYRLEKLRRIRSCTYQKAINFKYTRKWHFTTADAIIRAANGNDKIGSVGEKSPGWRKSISDNWYTDLLPASDQSLSELKRNAEFLRHLGVEGFRAGIPSLPIDRLPDVQGLPESFYVLVPGAGAEYRQWPLQRFAHVATKIYDNTGWTAIVSGSPDEAHLGDRLSEKAPVPVENWVGRTSVSEMASMIAAANLVVGNETSAIHIATAVSTPSVCILGGGHHGRFVPYDVEPDSERPLPRVAVHEMPCFNCDWNCIYEVPDDEPVPCITNISVEAVWKEVRSVLQSLETDSEIGSLSS